MNTGHKVAALLCVTLLLFFHLGGMEIHRLALLVPSTAILGLCIFSFRRCGETAEILRAGIVKAFSEFEDDDFQIDLSRFGRHTRFFVALMSLAILVYWLGIRVYVSFALGLVGATCVFCEFVLNFEVLGHLCSEPDATFSEVGASRVVNVYRALSLFHMAAITTAITWLLMA